MIYRKSCLLQIIVVILCTVEVASDYFSDWKTHVSVVRSGIGKSGAELVTDSRMQLLIQQTTFDYIMFGWFYYDLGYQTRYGAFVRTGTF